MAYHLDFPIREDVIRKAGMFSLALFLQQYETDTTEVAVNKKRFRFLIPKSIDRFIDPDDPLLDFPLWSKIWPAAVVLAEHLTHLKNNPTLRFLEIGAGMGVVSIVASHWGHHFTLTEINEHALNFARANAQINRYPNLAIKKLDWCNPDRQNRFDYIVGSEILYKEEYFQPLLALFKRLLKPKGQVILAGEIRKHDRSFYKAMEALFDLRIQRKVISTEYETIRIFIVNMRFKKMGVQSR